MAPPWVGGKIAGMADQPSEGLSSFDDALGRWLRRYRKGQLIVVEGQESHTFAILRRGIVGVHKDGQQIAAISEPGVYLGEMSYLLEGRRTASLRAETDVEAYVMPSDTFGDILTSSAHVALRVLKSVADRLRVTTHENAVLHRQVHRLQSGGAAPDIRSTSSGTSSVGRKTVGELVFLLRVALEHREDDPVLLSLLGSALHSDLISPGTHVVPERPRVLDLLQAISGQTSVMVDLKELVDRVKKRELTPVTRPPGSKELVKSLVPGQVNAVDIAAAARELAGRENPPKGDGESG